MQKVMPFLWFEKDAEEALNYYVSIFPDAEITAINRQTPDGPLFTGTFRLFNQNFGVMNIPTEHKFNESISFVVSCKDQEEVDHYWSKLADGGKELMCGWLTDKYGITWQIIPEELPQLLSQPDEDKRKRATDAMLKMRKIDIDVLKNA